MSAYQQYQTGPVTLVDPATGSPHVTDVQDMDQCLLVLWFYHKELRPLMLCLSRLGGMKSMDLRD